MVSGSGCAGGLRGPPGLRCSSGADITLRAEGELTLEENRELRASSAGKTGVPDSFSKYWTICHGA